MDRTGPRSRWSWWPRRPRWPGPRPPWPRRTARTRLAGWPAPRA